MSPAETGQHVVMDRQTGGLLVICTMYFEMCQHLSEILVVFIRIFFLVKMHSSTSVLDKFWVFVAFTIHASCVFCLIFMLVWQSFFFIVKHSVHNNNNEKLWCLFNSILHYFLLKVAWFVLDLLMFLNGEKWSWSLSPWEKHSWSHIEAMQ